MTERSWSEAGGAQEDVDWGRPAGTRPAAPPDAAPAAGPAGGFAEAADGFAAASPGFAQSLVGAAELPRGVAEPSPGFADLPRGFADAAGFALRDVERLLQEAGRQLRRSSPHDVPAEGMSRSAPSGDGPGSAGPAPLRNAPPDAAEDTPWDSLALRRRLLNHGHEDFAEEDLASLLLGLALPTDPRPLARAAVRHFGSFAALLSASERELRALRGFGTHGVAAVRLVQAAALRLRRAEVMQHAVLDRWDRVIAYLNAALARERIEQFRVLFLDAEDRLVADEAQARGTINHTPVYPREVARRALELEIGRAHV